MRFVLTICALLALTMASDASYRDGYVNQYGYTYHAASGYWRWSDGTYWRLEYRRVRDSYGCYYNQAYYYPAYPAYPQATPENYQEIVARSLANTKKHEEFMEAMKLAYPDYVDQPKRRGVAYEDKQLYGQVNTTLQIGQNSLDVNLTLQQILRAMEFGQTTTAQISGDVITAVREKVAGDNEVMRTLVAGFADEARLRAARSPLVVQKQYLIGEVKGGPPVMPEVIDPPGTFVPPPGLKTGAIRTDFGSLKADCVQCHGDKKAGGFAVDTFLLLPRERRIDIVVQHIMGHNPSKGMPRGADGKWHRLPDAKVMAWMEIASTAK